MKPYVEFKGKNVEQAVQNACKELNVSKGELKYDVISSGSSGIFGLVGVKKAVIRVAAKEVEKAGEKAGGGRSKDSASESVMSLVDEAFSGGRAKKKEPRKPAPKKPAPRRSNGRKPAPKKPSPWLAEPTRPEEDDAPVEEAVVETVVETGVDADVEVVETARKDLPVAETAPEAEEDVEDKAEDKAEAPAEPETPPEPREYPQESLDDGMEALKRIVGLISDDTVITIETDHERVLYNIEGGNSAVLIGKRGQTLEAIQYLVDKIVNKKSEERIRVQIDVEGYLETRKESLESLALRLAEKAKKTGRPSTISQMTAHDRRIVHLALREDKGVRTQSMGDGYYRRLVIFPRKSSYRKKRNGNRPRQNSNANANSKA